MELSDNFGQLTRIYFTLVKYIRVNFGQLTRIYFTKVKINPPLKESIFEFIAPEGVDIFEN